MGVLDWILTAFVIAGALPLVAGCYQFALAGLHRFRHRSRGELERVPNVAVVVPAWNEAAVIGRTIDTLLALDYPGERLRVYVVDDARPTRRLTSYGQGRRAPGTGVPPAPRAGGEGKAHTLNHGLRTIRKEGWYEAVLVIDADVIFTVRSLRRMVRHFGDPWVGAVTAYIKEGSRPANFMNRFVSYEYIAAQAGARRAQNVLGAQACLAGGAQLLRRESLEAIGGEIDTSSLAEDTFTTFNVQLAGGRVVFEPHAIVWAEEPRDIAGLWKQRLRWGRGNVQVTLRYRHVWLRRAQGPAGRRELRADLVLGLPDARADGALLGRAGHAVRPRPRPGARRLPLVLGAEPRDLSVRDPVGVRPGRLGGPRELVRGDRVPRADQPRDHRLRDRRAAGRRASGLGAGVRLRVAVGLDARRLPRAPPRVRHPSAGWLARPLLYVVGYGPLLCAITAAAYLAELRRADLVWEKTEKTGTVGNLA